MISGGLPFCKVALLRRRCGNKFACSRSRYALHRHNRVMKQPVRKRGLKALCSDCLEMSTIA